MTKLSAGIVALALGVATAGAQPPATTPKDQAKGAPQAGIQWYAIWQDAQREAQRTGRPILLVSAAPHCAGVSGIW